jgi:hypothetical protein
VARPFAAVGGARGLSREIDAASLLIINGHLKGSFDKDGCPPQQCSGQQPFPKGAFLDEKERLESKRAIEGASQEDGRDEKKAQHSSR